MKNILKKMLSVIRSKPHITRSQEWSMFRQSKDFRF